MPMGASVTSIESTHGKRLATVNVAYQPRASSRRASRGGDDHLDDGDVVTFPGVAEHRGARGVAGDDERLDPLLDEMVEAVEGVLANGGDRLGAIRLPGGVAEIENRLVRKLVDDGPRDGESTEARVEDADGCVRHKHRAYAG